MNDQLRYPPVYENESIREWQKTNLKAQDALRKNGLEFRKHYVGATACTPSRATIFTGQYPSLHGVTQTSGAAKTSFDADMFWLDSNTVPTMGDYFRKAGYNTYYKGKWHFSDEDIIVPNSYDPFLTYNPINGEPIKAAEDVYLRADRTFKYGFSGWIGPEPHGSDPRNSGSSAAIGTSGRDIVYAREAVELLEKLNQIGPDQEPWLMVASFVNPHDIALYGTIAAKYPTYNFEVDPTVPFVPPPPTADEDLSTKPIAQRSYKEVYPKAFQPILDLSFYRRLYYSLQKKADQETLKVFETLKSSCFYEDTIVLFFADHGELLGAHGGLHQKWYQAYEESIHVPLIIHNPILFPTAQSTDVLTSHVDIIPTMLGLAEVDVPCISEQLKKTHIETRRLVGRDLSPLIVEGTEPPKAGEPIYFMTDDNVTQGDNQVTVTGKPYQSVVQPNQVESVIVYLPTGECEELELWKYSRYFESTNPLANDTINPYTSDDSQSSSDSSDQQTEIKEQFEMYNVTTDQLETRNLANPMYATPKTRQIQKLLTEILVEQRQLKRLFPRTLPNQE